MFLTRFFIANILCCIFILILSCIKKLFSKQLSSKYVYFMWFPLFLILIMPFFPLDAMKKLNFMSAVYSLHQPGVTSNISSLSNSGRSLFKDFYEITARPFFHISADYFYFIWILGIVLGLFVFFLHAVQIRHILRFRISPSRKISLLFADCKKELQIKKSVLLFESSRISSPVTFGLLPTYVILPSSLEEYMKPSEIRHILLHELIHKKHGDLIINYFSCILQTLYWFNPLLWFGFHRMREDLEIRCDNSVMELLKEEEQIYYGYTLLNFSKYMINFPFKTGTHLIRSKTSLKKEL